MKAVTYPLTAHRTVGNVSSVAQCKQMVTFNGDTFTLSFYYTSRVIDRLSAGLFGEIKQYSSTGIQVIVLCIAQNAIFKYHPEEISCNENLYRIVHLASNVAFQTR